MSLRSLRLAFELKKIAEDDKRPSSKQTLFPGKIKQEEQVEVSPVSQDSRPRITNDGFKRYYDSFDRLHRLDGPAVISPDGNQLYFQHGKLHRDNGPAAILHNGGERWYFEGDEIPPLEIIQLMINKGKVSIQDIDTLKELAEIAFFDYSKIDKNAVEQAKSIFREKGIITETANIHVIVNFLKEVQKL